jgi:PTH1 family peptidyl-tRNA hydrolase
MVQDARVEMKDGTVQRVNLVKPTTFMNLSGECVQPMLRFYKSSINDMVVVMDEIDLPLGTIRLRAQGGPGGHRGLDSVIQHTGSTEIKRVRVGVGRDARISAADWVLQPFRTADQAEADVAIGRAADAVEHWIVTGDWNAAMNTFNATAPTANPTNPTNPANETN